MTVAAHPFAILAPGLCRNPCQFRCDSLRAQSPSCLSLAQTSCPALPSRVLSVVIVGPLGLGSPRVRARCLTAPRPAVLCVATTTFVLPGRCACRSLPVPWVDALDFVSLPACAGVGSSADRVGQPMP